MPKLDELNWIDATTQAELVRKKEISPLELVEHTIERTMKLLKPQLTSYVMAL